MESPKRLLLAPSHRRGAALGTAGAYFKERRRTLPGTTITESRPARIKCGKRTHLHVLVHEFAHHLNHLNDPERAKKRCHGKTFKLELALVYAYAIKYLKD